MMAITNLFIVGEPTNGPYLAQRFVTEFEQRKNDMFNDADYPDDPQCRKVIDFTLTNGLDLRKFQRAVIDTFDQYAMAFFDDDLVQELIEGNESANLYDVINIVAEFQASNPGYIVQSLVPLDLKGAFGFVVKAV